MYLVTFHHYFCIKCILSTSSTTGDRRKARWRCEGKVSEGEEWKIKATANYVQNERKTEKDDEKARTETFNYSDGVMGAGWSGRLHTGGLIPHLVLCVFSTWGQGDGRHWIIPAETFEIHELAPLMSRLSRSPVHSLIQRDWFLFLCYCEPRMNQ